MNKLVVAVAFLIAAMSTAFAQRQVNTDVPYSFGARRYAHSDVYYDFAPGTRAHIIKVNAPEVRTYNVTARMPLSDALRTAGRLN